MDRLPQKVEAAIRGAYTDYQQAWVDRHPSHKEKAENAAQLILAAKNAGWPATYLADLCGVSTRRLHATVIAHGNPDGTFPSLPTGPLFKQSLDNATAQELRDLAQVVRTARGNRTTNPTIKQASERFTELLIQLRDSGVSWTELSAATTQWASWPIPPRTRTRGGHTVGGLQARVNRSRST